MLHQQSPLWAEERDAALLQAHPIGVPLSSFYLAYILLPTDRWYFSRRHIGPKWTDLIFSSGYDSEIVAHMIRIDNVAFAFYKTLSFLFYVTRNMDTFLLIAQTP